MNAASNPTRQLLLVEDNPGDSDLILDLLDEPGARRLDVAHVTTLAAAVEQLKRLTVDAVLLDLGLPDSTGVDCVTSIRQHGGEVPIVVLTGLDDDELALRCLGAGAQDYLSKQEVRTQSLRRAIDYAIARVDERAARARAATLQRRLAAIVETSSDAIVSCALDGRVTSWNGGAERILGLTRADALGQSFEGLIGAPGEALFSIEAQGALADLAGGGAPTAREITTLRRDGSPLTLSVATSALRDADGVLVGYASICRDISAAKRRDAELRRKNEELLARERQMSALAARLNAVREEERKRISRTVHDDLGQLLTALKLDLGWIGRRLSPEAHEAEGIKARLTEASASLDLTVETVQRIATDLRPSALDSLGLAAAVRDEARRFQQRTGVVSEVHVGTEAKPDDRTATTLFRILQELLTNVARHAQATHLRISLDEADGAWLLRVADDGVGFSIDVLHRATSLGLLGVQERAQSSGGTATWEVKPGYGTVATVWIPRDPPGR